MKLYEKVSELLHKYYEHFEKTGRESTLIYYQIDNILHAGDFRSNKYQVFNIKTLESTPNILEFWIEWRTINQLNSYDEKDSYYYYNISVDIYTSELNIKVSGSNPDYKNDVKMYINDILMREL